MSGTTSQRVVDQRWQAWQSVDSGRLVLGSATLALVVVAFARTAEVNVAAPHVAIAFGAFIAFGELLRLSLPGGREAAPIAMSAALAYAMVLEIAQRPPAPPLPGPPAWQVVAVTAIGMAVGALPHIAAGRRAGFSEMSARLIAVAWVAFTFRPLAGEAMLAKHWVLAAAAMAMLTALGWLLETIIVAIIRADDLRARYSVMLTDEMRVQWRLGLAAGTSAIITVFGAQVMGLYELLVFAGPLLVIQLAFRRYAGIRATYLQTVRALAQVTEVGGYTESGHSRRVGKLALVVGRELGMAEPDLLNLEYAALMHDIGQLALPEPIPGGATTGVTPFEAHRIADYGAEVIKQTGVLDVVAEIVRCQWLPARGGPAQPPLASRIIRAVNAFDDLTGGSVDRDRIGEALHRLRTETGAEYDPVVVAALAMVTSRLPVSRL
jgi:HD-GYP domain-containing protein (c-di-GMP phosphodiesterase class II)